MARNTLQTLRWLVAVLWAADVLLLIASLVGADLHRRGLQTIGRDTAPSIIAAQHIKASLAGMDGAVAMALLARTPDEKLTRLYETWRQEAAGALLGAAENITFGEAERKPIRDLQLGLGTYEARSQKARDLYERHDAAYLPAYIEAMKEMDNVLLPAATALDRANLAELEAAYERQRTRSVWSRSAVLLSSIVLLFVFVSAQTYLSRRTNRTLNLPLVAATLLVFGWAGWVMSSLSLEQNELKIAREDAFASVHTLWQARATAYAAQADGSRALLNIPGANAGFAEKTESLLKIRLGESIRDIVISAGGPGKVMGISGLLADELNNLTFEGERAAALDAVMKFDSFLQNDAQRRRLEQAGKHNEAIAVVMGSGGGEFDVALGKVIDINQREFDRAVEDGFHALRYFEWKASGVAALIAILALVGLLQRIAEYR